MKSVWFIFIFISHHVFAQVDTTLTVETIEIAASKLRQNPVGSQTQTFNASMLQTLTARNVAELLQQESGIFIKNYGSGSLATSSIRGGNAGHTLLLWNDLPIQSPMLGLLDLSLLPTNLMDEISVQQGGGTAMWGSGAVGGVVALKNQANFENQLATNARMNFASFGGFQQDLSVKIGNEKMQSHTKLSYQKADNNFAYWLSPTFQRTNENAHFYQQNLLQDFYFKPTYNQVFAIHFWYQRAYREIPPTSVQTRSEAKQKDAAFRFMLDWKSMKNRMVLNSKVGFFKEYLDYFDDVIHLTSLSDFSTFLGEFDVQIHLDKHQKIYLGTTQTFTKAMADSYNIQPTEYRAALFAAYHWHYNTWKSQVSIRQEAVNERLVPMTYMIGIEKLIKNNFIFNFKINKNYRLPTLNDRFWQPGGNPDLLPEKGWNKEVTLNYKKIQNHCKFNILTTVFNRNTNNWIMWSQLEGQQFWSANNLTKVWSRGVEQRFYFQYEKEKWKYDFSIGYNWVRSTNQIAIDRPKIPANQQLFYTPEHQVFTKLELQRQPFYATYYHSFTSATLGINEDLKAYNLGNLQIRYALKTKNLQGHLAFNIQNIWNTNYYIVERRPMAGRSWGIVFFVQNKK